MNEFDDSTVALVPTTDFARALRNIVDNAVRHTNESGVVLLTGKVTDHNAVINVSDACGGIPAQDFDRGFQSIAWLLLHHLNSVRRQCASDLVS